MNNNNNNKHSVSPLPGTQKKPAFAFLSLTLHLSTLPTHRTAHLTHSCYINRVFISKSSFSPLKAFIVPQAALLPTRMWWALSLLGVPSPRGEKKIWSVLWCLYRNTILNLLLLFVYAHSWAYKLLEGMDWYWA